MMMRLLRFIVGVVLVCTIPIGFLGGILCWVVIGRNYVAELATWVVTGEADNW